MLQGMLWHSPPCFSNPAAGASTGPNLQKSGGEAPACGHTGHQDRYGSFLQLGRGQRGDWIDRSAPHVSQESGQLGLKAFTSFKNKLGQAYRSVSRELRKDPSSRNSPPLAAMGR